MKKTLRTIAINFLALWLTGQLVPSLDYAENWQILLWAALALTVVNLIIKPVLNLLLLPITFLTLGAFRWVVNILGLYLVTLAVPGFGIQPFDFSGFSYQGFVIPSFHASLIYAFTITSFAISFIAGFIFWLVEK